MDDDPVLRALGVEIERDDPRLAALLRAGPTPAARTVRAATTPRPVPSARRRRHRRRPPGWVLALGGVLAGVLVVLVSVRLGLAAFGVFGILLLLASPVAACLWCATAEELRPPDSWHPDR